MDYLAGNVQLVIAIFGFCIVYKGDVVVLFIADSIDAKSSIITPYYYHRFLLRIINQISN